MAAMRLTHLAILLAAPLTVAAATGLSHQIEEIEELEPATPPHVAPADGGELAGSAPARRAERPRRDRLGARGRASPRPARLPAEYPLAVAFNPAHQSNYGAGELRSHDYIVIHTIEGYYEGAQRWFQNPAADVSTQFCVRSRDGEVTQMVSTREKAWHVGPHNAHALGIEHEGFVDEPAWYTWESYRSSARLARWLADRHDIPRDRGHIVGHSELPGQTHEDPGPGWDWDMYMALIEDVVPQGRVEGWVVDREAGCALLATRDTWLKRTLEDVETLEPAATCSLAAGTELPYLHLTEIDGHLALTFEPDAGPCAGLFGLARRGYVVADHVVRRCAHGSSAVAGVTIVLDGGRRVVSDERGAFSFVEVEPGPHTLDVLGGSRYHDTVEPIVLDEFPGLRVIVALDPR